MSERHDTMMNPRIETLLGKSGSKFQLVTLGSRRARQINNYFNALGQGGGSDVPPQVTSVARKSLSIAFEEIAVDKIVGIEDPGPAIPEVVAEVPEEAEEAAEAEDKS